jgi:hypothetical protein
MYILERGSKMTYDEVIAQAAAQIFVILEAAGIQIPADEQVEDIALAQAPEDIEEVHSQYAELRWIRPGWYRPLRDGNWHIWKWHSELTARQWIDAEWFANKEEGNAFLASHTPDGSILLVAPQDEFLEEPASVREGCVYSVVVHSQKYGALHIQTFRVFAFFKEAAEEAIQIRMELDGVKDYQVVSFVNMDGRVLTLV